MEAVHAFLEEDYYGEEAYTPQDVLVKGILLYLVRTLLGSVKECVIRTKRREPEKIETRYSSTMEYNSAASLLITLLSVTFTLVIS